MIYAAKPQRGGKSIPANTNNTPQDPPPPPISELKPDEVFIPIENTIPTVPEIEPIVESIPEPIVESIPELVEIPEPIVESIPELVEPIPEPIVEIPEPIVEIPEPILISEKVSWFRRFTRKILRILGRKLD